MTLTYRDHIGGKSSKIIPWLVSLGCSLFADPNKYLLQTEHLLILAGIGEGIVNSAFGVQKLYNIYEIRQGMTKVTIEVQ